MNVVPEKVSPPVGPTRVPTTCNLSQAIAPGVTDAEATSFAQTVLVFRESCHVTRTGVSTSSGLGLKKWVMSCSLLVVEQRGLRREQCPRDLPNGR